MWFNNSGIICKIKISNILSRKTVNEDEHSKELCINVYFYTKIYTHVL